MSTSYEKLIIAGALALGLGIVLTPLAKRFAYIVGAIDVPKDARRMHKVPIPRLGGLAIFFGFITSVLIFANITTQIRGILIGAVIMVFIGVLDDIKPLHAALKFVIQIIAALVAVAHGVVIEAFSNPFLFLAPEYLHLKSFSIPMTVFWIVAITNAINFIDGLDGLAVGVSTISAVFVLVISLMVSDDLNVALVMAALTGACLGFIPYNFNPAKIFMGDSGALLLGYVLSTISIHGLFKFYTVMSFTAPFLVLALPLFDTSFAFFRRLLKGQKPWTPDRGHLHHRLIDLGLSQKQAVIILYAISGVSGLAAIIAATNDEISAFKLMGILLLVTIIFFIVYKYKGDPSTIARKGENPVASVPDSEGRNE